MKHIVFLTGAGISAESGLKTFRDSDGLWEGYDVYEVASPMGWAKKPQLVLDFYNMRRKDVLNAIPNAAHQCIAALETTYKVTVITQNIDDLHERAGSTNIMHLHGQITKCRSVGDTATTYPYNKDLMIGDKGTDGMQLRPHIVWFGEAVPMMDQAISVVHQADIFVIVGTSLQVYPAASLVDYLPMHCHKYMVDKSIPLMNDASYYRIEKSATEGLTDLYKMLMP